MVSLTRWSRAAQPLLTRLTPSLCPPHPQLFPTRLSAMASSLAQTKTFNGPTFTLSDGRVMPAIAWGNCDMHGQGPDFVATDIAPRAFNSTTNYEHLDTAQCYHNQKGTAEFLAKHDPEQKLFLTTKVSSPDEGSKSLDEARSTILETIDILGRQPDVLLIHNPFVATDGVAKLWQVLDELKDEGKLTASLGFSNFRPQDIEAVMKVAKHKPTVHQLEVHPYVLSHIQDVLDLDDKYGIVTTSYGPLTPYSKHKTGGPAKPILEKIAERLSKDSGEEIDGSAALVLYLRSKGIMPVIGSHNPDRLKKYLDTGKLPTLSADEIKQIDEEGKKIYFRNFDEHMGPDGYPRPNLPQDI